MLGLDEIVVVCLLIPFLSGERGTADIARVPRLSSAFDVGEIGPRAVRVEIAGTSGVDNIQEGCWLELGVDRGCSECGGE